jgi:hypothetical protein
VTWTDQRPLRWSKKTEQLVHYVAQNSRPGLQSELGHWLEERPRYRDLIAFNQDKVRKKLNTSDEEMRQDVRAELRVAYLVLADRRFEVVLEAYGAQRLGPDLSVTYRRNQRFNLEVTRLRTSEAPSISRLADVIGGKLRQLPAEVPNALVVTGRGLGVSEESLEGGLKVLRSHGKQKELTRLSGVFVLDEAAEPAAAVFLANREARHALSSEIVAGLSTSLSPA